MFSTDALSHVVRFMCVFCHLTGRCNYYCFVSQSRLSSGFLILNEVLLCNKSAFLEMVQSTSAFFNDGCYGLSAV